MDNIVAVRWSAALVALAAVIALAVGASAGAIATYHADGTTSTTSTAPDGGHPWID